MSKPIAVVAADCHLDHLIWRSRPEIRGDSAYGFWQTINAAKARKLPTVLAGDVVETLHADSPNSDTVHVLCQAMSQMRQASLHVYSTRGQHDLADTDWLYACGGYPPPTRQDRVNIGGRSFAFLPWMPPAMLQEVIPETSADVVVCHQVWKELMGGSSSEGKLASFQNVSMVISGDYHRRVTKYVRRKSQEPLYVLSPGATHMRKINEPTTHCIAILHDDLSVKWVKLKSRKVVRVSITDEASIANLLRSLPVSLDEVAAETAAKQMPSELLTPLLIVSDTSDLLGVEARLREVVGDRAHVFYSSRSLVAVDDEGFTPSGAEDYSLSEFVRSETGPDTAVADLLESLLAPDANVPETIKTHEGWFLNAVTTEVKAGQRVPARITRAGS